MFHRQTVRLPVLQWSVSGFASGPPDGSRGRYGRLNSVRARSQKSTRFRNQATARAERAQPTCPLSTQGARSPQVVAGVAELERCGWMRGYAGGWAGLLHAAPGGYYGVKRQWW